MSAIHIKYPALTFKAGQRALRHIRERGLQAADCLLYTSDAADE